jgi:hypothetical protein
VDRWNQPVQPLALSSIDVHGIDEDRQADTAARLARYFGGDAKLRYESNSLQFAPAAQAAPGKTGCDDALR